MDWILDEFYITNENLDFELDGLYPNFIRRNKYHIGLPFCYYAPKSKLTFKHTKTEKGSVHVG